MQNKELTKWLEVADSIAQAKKKLPYHINVIDELHINENAHTRILTKLLQQQEGDCYPILESFLHYLQVKLGQNVDWFVCRPTIEAGKSYIDALIRDRDETGRNYAIIIENKIYWAVDQDKQIERYVEFISTGAEKIDLNHIYVIYLTSDGDKEIENYSFTSQVRVMLDYKNKEETGRFILMNYKYDILPWLKKEVLPNCRVKEEYLQSALRQYIDFLEGMFGLRTRSEAINKEIKHIIYQGMDMMSNDSVTAKYRKIGKTIKSLEAVLTELDNEKRQLRSILMDKVVTPFEEITKGFFEKELPSRVISISNALKKEGKDYFFFYFDGWGWEIHFEWYPFTVGALLNNSLSLHFHVEGKRKSMWNTIFQDPEFRKVLKTIGVMSKEKGNGLFLKSYDLPKSFADMNQNERISFLTNVYEEIVPLIPIIDRIIRTS